MEKIETLIYLFVLQLALAASLLRSPGTPSHTLELKINSFYLGRGSNGFLIWRKYKNNGWARRQRTGGRADPRRVPGREAERATRPLPAPRERGQSESSQGLLWTSPPRATPRLWASASVAAPPLGAYRHPLAGFVSGLIPSSVLGFGAAPLSRASVSSSAARGQESPPPAPLSFSQCCRA